MGRSRFWCTAVWLLAAALLGGCGRAEPAKGFVSGVVTLDGKPLERGSVLFVSADNTLPSSSGEIKDGAYRAEVYVGPMNVQVLSPRVVGKRKLYDTPDSPVRDVTEESIPAKYNTHTELTYEVKPGEQEKNFVLTSK